MNKTSFYYEEISNNLKNSQNYLSLIFFALEQTQVDLTVQSYNILLHFGFFFLKLILDSCNISDSLQYRSLFWHYIFTFKLWQAVNYQKLGLYNNHQSFFVDSEILLKSRNHSEALWHLHAVLVVTWPSHNKGCMYIICLDTRYKIEANLSTFFFFINKAA